MKKGALLHFDFEFTHPVPGRGQAMAMAAIAEEAIFFEDGGFEVKDGTAEYESILPVNGMAYVVDWVNENQAELLEKSRRLLRDGMTHARANEMLVRFLRRVAQDFGEHIVPVGWCLGSDIAFLLSMLKEDNHMVHYEALDITGMLLGKFGRTMDSEELNDMLDLPDNDDPHDPMADVRYQRSIFHAVLNFEH